MAPNYDLSFWGTLQNKWISLQQELIWSKHLSIWRYLPWTNNQRNFREGLPSNKRFCFSLHFKGFTVHKIRSEAYGLCFGFKSDQFFTNFGQTLTLSFNDVDDGGIVPLVIFHAPQDEFYMTANFWPDVVQEKDLDEDHFCTMEYEIHEYADFNEGQYSCSQWEYDEFFTCAKEK